MGWPFGGLVRLKKKLKKVDSSNFSHFFLIEEFFFFLLLQNTLEFVEPFHAHAIWTAMPCLTSTEVFSQNKKNSGKLIGPWFVEN